MPHDGVEACENHDSNWGFLMPQWAVIPSEQVFGGNKYTFLIRQGPCVQVMSWGCLTCLLIITSMCDYIYHIKETLFEDCLN